MRLVRARSLVGALLAVAILAPQASAAQSGTATAPDPLILELEEIVDPPRPSARREAALAMAERGHELDELLAAMESFGRFTPLDPGLDVRRVPLQVGEQTEQTELVLYVPTGYRHDQPAPLLMSFHGTGGSGRNSVGMWRGVAEELDMLVLAPSEAGDNAGYAFSDRERQAALAALRWLRRRCNVDEDRVLLTGVSRGGHLAWDLALRYPHRFAAIAPMIGGPRIQISRAQNNLRYVENVTHLAIRDLQGAGDDPGLIFNLRLAFERLDSYGAENAELLLQEGHGHSFDFKAVDWVEFLGGARRDVFPDEIVRRASRENQGRAAYLELLTLTKKVEEVFSPKMSQRKWSRLDADGQRRSLQKLVDDRTARLSLRYEGAGRFKVKSRGVKSFRLLLPRELLESAKQLTISWNGRATRKKPRSSKAVLLTEFAERFDRRFLPVAELELR